MPLRAVPVPGGSSNTSRTSRYVLDQLDGGLSTRTFPTLLPINRLQMATNAFFGRDGLVSKRPGNILYGNGSGATGGGDPIMALDRFYFGFPKTGYLVAASGGNLYYGNDTNGAFTEFATAAVSATANPTFTQMYDPDVPAGGGVALFVCDGVNIPHYTRNFGEYNEVKTGTSGGTQFLPNGVRSGAPITPAYCVDWNYRLVYAGEPTDPGSLYISDALRPERFNGYALVTSDATPYIPYYPGGQDGTLGDITGIKVINGNLVIFYTAGIVTCFDTGSYGAYEFVFQRVSSSTGATSPRSIVSFDTFAVFFGGDRYYVTQGNPGDVTALADLLPTIYNTTLQPPAIANIHTVFGVREQNRYWSSFDSTGSGVLDTLVVFDFAANGGWQPGQQSTEVPDEVARGGAWAVWNSMPVNAAVECRGPGDDFQLFWGASTADRVAQFARGLNVWTDFGQNINCDFLSKSLFLEMPPSNKSPLALYPILVYQSTGTQFTSTPTPYVIIGEVVSRNCQALSIVVPPSGTAYGTAPYGTFDYESSTAIEVVDTPKAFPLVPYPGISIAAGIQESSAYPFNFIGFVLEITEDEPQP